MKTFKMSLENIQGKLSRAEMKKVMAGSGTQGNCTISCSCNGVNYGYVCSVQDCWNKC